MQHQLLKYGLAAVMAANLSVSAAEVHQHEGDIQPWKANGQIELNAYLFEADFGDLSGGLYSTDDPGYDADTDHGAFGAGNWLQFTGLGNLQFWDGSSWGTPVAGETVHIEDAVGNTTIFGGASITNPQGVIGEFDSAGDIHEHLDMEIRTAANALGGTVGAYWITLQLFESLPNSQDALAISSTYDIIFNRGLGHEDFETAVSTVTAPVPLPGAAWLFAPALVSLLGVGRRRSAASNWA
ncbi:PEP-CTERM sorting domain-containing protein [Methylomonas koyamae]|uniref:PEP-CTERM sorting domain-containing protein n=1 Tax=Methylomonas koyamae TaxID=702114 RepID=UPI000BC2C8F3|nr:PEP-CTERM sorting domain-containing protein [Methylomonas koyamae]ATG89383.1 hypothetical protein MKLM6_1126 [Methylomonas koyamae]